MLGLVLLTGRDGVGGLAPFYAMPIVAGAGWAWVLSLITRRRRGIHEGDSRAI
jgi:hypothetical protein